MTKGLKNYHFKARNCFFRFSSFYNSFF